MAFALTGVHAYGVEIDESVTSKFKQYMKLKGTATTADVAYDFGACVAGALGTFWTAVSGSEPGATALAAIQQISAVAEEWLAVKGSIVNAKAPVAADAVGSYVVTQANKCPKVTLHAGEGVTAFVVELEWDIPSGVSPVSVKK